MSGNSSGDGGPAEKRYWGKYRGIVADDQDPMRLARLKCRVPEIIGDMVTDWASPTVIPYGGGLNYGAFEVPPIGSAVFVVFESGDVNRPTYGGTWWGLPSGQAPEPPALTRSDGKTCWKSDPSTQSPKGDDKWKTAACEDACQPVSPLRSRGGVKYPNNQVRRTKNNGIVVEIDDTPNLGRVHLWHGPSKSWFEIDNTGEFSVRINGKTYWLTEKDHQLHVKGNADTYAEGKMTDRVGGDRWLQVGGASKRVLSGEETSWVQGPEKRVSYGGLKQWSFGDRVDVVFGNFKQFIMGKMQTNVFGIYERLASGIISDQASLIFHGGGGPSGSPPTPPSTPSCGGTPSCPVPSVDNACAPLPKPS